MSIFFQYRSVNVKNVKSLLFYSCTDGGEYILQHDMHSHATVVTGQVRQAISSHRDLCKPNDRFTGMQSKHSCCRVREKVCVCVSRFQPKLKLPQRNSTNHQSISLSKQS